MNEVCNLHPTANGKFTGRAAACENRRIPALVGTLRYRLQFRRYRLPFRTFVRTSYGVWQEREGLIVRLEDERGAVGYGEVAPIPEFGTEEVAQAEAALLSLGDAVESEALAGLPVGLPCTRNALAAARSQLADDPARASGTTLGVAALLPAGRAALAQIGPRAEAGFRVFKWKVGVGETSDELALLDDLCAELPSGARLRLDANGAWDRRRAERWLERCAERPVEFVEQPVAASMRGAGDLLLGLAGDYPTPIALDESLVGDTDLEKWLGAGWPGMFVIKPSLHANPGELRERLLAVRSRVVFSSALETAVGARAALLAAFNVAVAQGAGEKVILPAVGFGVWPLFAEGKFDGPAAAPYLRFEDVQRIDPAAVWSALS